MKTTKYEKPVSIPSEIAHYLNWCKNRYGEGLVEKVPPGSVWRDLDGKVVYTIGYCKFADGKFGVNTTDIDPRENYTGAVDTRKPTHLSCFLSSGVVMVDSGPTSKKKPRNVTKKTV